MKDCGRKVSTIYIEGKTQLVDTDCIDILPGDKVVVIRHDGSIAVVDGVTNYRKEGLSARAALEPLDEWGHMFARCEIIGRVVGYATA